MNLEITREGNNVAVHKDFVNVEDRGEITQFISELELLKLELLELYKNWDDHK